MKQTQKLMDATNLMHAQEPQGTISAGVHPDGTVGLLVRPLPPDTLPPPPPPPTIMPISQGTSISMSVYPSQSQQQQLQLQPHQISSQVPFLASPSAPTLPQPPFIASHSALSLPQPPLVPGLTTHPRPGMVMNLSGDINAVDTSRERWEPTPFVPPARSSVVSGGSSGLDHSSTRPTWLTESVGGLPVSSTTSSNEWSNSSPSTVSTTPGTVHSHISGYSSHLRERGPQEIPISTIANNIPFNNSSHVAMNQALMPPRPRHNPHEPIKSII
ncbi:hypothetical protein BGZ49_006397 [Haplosporangium sp. Z 27]|nr:hypothetical protein BGZ49_006397 [Haplosporangium sp. Z 27]